MIRKPNKRHSGIVMANRVDENSFILRNLSQVNNCQKISVQRYNVKLIDKDKMNRKCKKMLCPHIPQETRSLEKSFISV